MTAKAPIGTLAIKQVNVGLLLNEADDLRTNGIKNVKVLTKFFASVFTGLSSEWKKNKKQMSHSSSKGIKEDFENYSLISLTSVPVRIMQQTFLKRRLMKEKNVAENS